MINCSSVSRLVILHTNQRLSVHDMTSGSILTRTVCPTWPSPSTSSALFNSVKFARGILRLPVLRSKTTLNIIAIRSTTRDFRAPKISFSRAIFEGLDANMVNPTCIQVMAIPTFIHDARHPKLLRETLRDRRLTVSGRCKRITAGRRKRPTRLCSRHFVAVIEHPVCYSYGCTA